ncbi:MAG: hypothetical protein DELT_01469 [Desulfovibrio sp.]
MKKQRSICHVTAHLGGGVGAVIMCWVKNAPMTEAHSVLCLDKNNDEDWRELVRMHPHIHIEDNAWKRKDFVELLQKTIADSDIVVVHWWNHPLLYDIMLNTQWPDCRLIAWNHATCLHAPYVVSKEIVEFADLFVCTSPITHELPDFDDMAGDGEDKRHVIWSTVGVDAFKNIQRAERGTDFIVGYTGTVDKGKLHPQYIAMCAKAHCHGMHFVVCSGDSQQHLKKQAITAGVTDAFSFMGRVPSVLPYLASYDVFGYPLQSKHFGSCEQALGEAMMAGCVPVVLSNPAESYIVEHGQSGFVAQDEKEYVQTLKHLYHNRDIIPTLAENAKKRALKLYDLDPVMKQWEQLFEIMMSRPKQPRSYYKVVRQYSPAELYLAALGKFSAPLQNFVEAKTITEQQRAIEKIQKLFSENSMFYSQNKGSVFQYLQFFPHDRWLKSWGDIATKERLLS